MVTRAELKNRAKNQLGKNIFGQTWMMALLLLFLQGLLAGAAGSILPGIGAIIVTGPLLFGVSFAFLKNARGGELDIADMFSGFSKDFGGSFLLGLMISIFTALWSLLFIIPGIIKTYSYSMAFYIKNDHPEYDWNQCIKESMKIMNGHKWELFVLDLSFIGWYFVGALCLGIGTLWVAPYHFATRTQFYLSLNNYNYN